MVDKKADADVYQMIELGRRIYSLVDSPALRQKLITRLPATSPACHLLRRQLAYAWVFDNSSASLTANLSDGKALQQIHVLFRDMADGAHRINYDELAAKATMLDVAIDAGFSDRNFASKSAEEKSFNQDVDTLAKTLRDVESRLTRGGYTDVSKHTAKEALDRPWFRLLFAVRTRSPPQGDRLGLVGNRGEQERSSKVMSGWVQRPKTKGDASDCG